jgi:hypothetical protein
MPTSPFNVCTSRNRKQASGMPLLSLLPEVFSRGLPNLKPDNTKLQEHPYCKNIKKYKKYALHTKQR